MQVKVLGPGCTKCRKLYDVAARAIADSGVTAELIKVEKMDDIVAYGIAMTPGLVIGDEVKSTGKIPSVAEISAWLKEARSAE